MVFLSLLLSFLFILGDGGVGGRGGDCGWAWVEGSGVRVSRFCR